MKKPINIEMLTPKWDHTIEVRTGVFVRVLSPLEHRDPDSDIRAGLVWRCANLWRRACIKVWGRPPVKMLREQVSAMIAPEDRRIVRELSDGELLRTHAAYVGLQSQWYAGISAAVAAAAAKSATDKTQHRDTEARRDSSGVGIGDSGVGRAQGHEPDSRFPIPDSRLQRQGVAVSELVHEYGPGGGRLPQAIGGMRIGAAAE